MNDKTAKRKRRIRWMTRDPRAIQGIYNVLALVHPVDRATRRRVRAAFIKGAL